MTTVNVTLIHAIIRGDTSITAIAIRKPAAGELRGVKLLDLAQLDTGAMIEVLPRITSPILTKSELAVMDIGDFMACAAEVAGFLVAMPPPEDSPTA